MCRRSDSTTHEVAEKAGNDRRGYGNGKLADTLVEPRALQQVATVEQPEYQQHEDGSAKPEPEERPCSLLGLETDNLGGELLILTGCTDFLPLTLGLLGKVHQRDAAP